MLHASGRVEKMLGSSSPDVKALAGIFLALYLLAATQVSVRGRARLPYPYPYTYTYPYPNLTPTPTPNRTLTLAVALILKDIAVDGLALTALSPRNRELAATCNAIGQSAGYLLAYAGFLFLSSRGLCNIGGFMAFWGW